MKWIAQFGRFWYDFVVGDDWSVAVVVVAAVGICAFVAHRDATAWPIVPVAATGALALSIARGARAARRDAAAERVQAGEGSPPC